MIDAMAATLLITMIAILATATVVGHAVRSRVGRSRPGIDNLVTRIHAWWVLVALVVAGLAAGSTGTTLLFAAVSFVALREFVMLAPVRVGDQALVLAAFGIVLPVQYLLVWHGMPGAVALFVPIGVFLALPVLVALAGDGRDLLRRAGTVQWGLMLCVFCLSHVPLLFALDIPGYTGRNGYLVVFLLAVVQASDVLQYIWGRLAGRRQVAPSISPSKTIEGLAGGLASATALGASLAWITPFTIFEAAALSLLVTVLGFAGGLVLSAIKRDRGIKDWSATIPGHGGVLDRVDSLCLSAPVFYHVVQWGWS
jgi:phosphatidate cytidylyltransferase